MRACSSRKKNCEDGFRPRFSTSFGEGHEPFLLLHQGLALTFFIWHHYSYCMINFAGPPCVDGDDDQT